MDYIDKWRILYKIHQITKSFFIKTEEFDLNLRTFLQPHNELKSAYEHLLRAESVRIGIREPDSNSNKETYINTNIDKALGHEYRAFFDTADWISINLREKIISELSAFSSDDINIVIPEYYPKWRPHIDKISEEIAKLRSNKDIGNIIYIEDELNNYEKIINELFDIHKIIREKRGSLIELQKKTKKSRIYQWIIIPLVVGIISGLIVFLVTK